MQRIQACAFPTLVEMGLQNRSAVLFFYLFIFIYFRLSGFIYLFFYCILIQGSHLLFTENRRRS